MHKDGPGRKANIHNKVRFLHSTKTDRAGKQTQTILEGKIKEYTAAGGYLIQVTSMTLHGTLCNRGEADILEVL